MPGFANNTFPDSIMWTDNVDFSGNVIPDRAITTDGQLLIGSTTRPNIQPGILTSPLGTITIGYNSPNITLDLAGGAAAAEKFAVQTGTSPVVPSGGIVTFSGATVAAGTNPVRTDGTTPNTMVLEVQRSQAIAATDATKIGLSNFNSAQFTVDANGFVSALSQAFNYTAVTGPTTYVVLSTDYYISCDPSAGAITLQFPNAPTFKRLWVVKDRTGSAATNNISLTTAGGTVTFDGLTTYVMNSNFQAVNLLANATPNYEVY